MKPATKLGMKPALRYWRHFLFVVVALFCAEAHAHSASDAYLTLTVDQHGIHGQWDVALRDLDFVLKLDDDGNGDILWRELRKHQAQIATYAFSFLKVSAGNQQCKIVPTRQLVDSHADGAYAALFFDVVCSGAPTRVTLDYRLFFAIDPSHRGILLMRSGEKIATALMSPQNARIELAL